MTLRRVAYMVRLLERLARGCATFLRTHDLRLAARAEVTLECGTHRELMQANGRYASLYRLRPATHDHGTHEESHALTC